MYEDFSPTCSTRVVKGTTIHYTGTNEKRGVERIHGESITREILLPPLLSSTPIFMTKVRKKRGKG